MQMAACLYASVFVFSVRAVMCTWTHDRFGCLRMCVCEWEQYDAILHRQSGTEMLADVDAATVAQFLKHLKKFKLRSKVSVENLSSNMAVAWSSEQPGDTKLPPDPRMNLLGYRGIIANSDAHCSNGSAEAGDELYRAERLRLGIGEGSELEGEVPLECNFDGLNGVSFTKGCYVGQELIARTHFRGAVRKRLVPITATSHLPDAVAKGTNIARLSGKGRSPGRVVCLDTTGYGLALLRLNNLHDTDMCVPTSDGGSVSVTAHQPDWWPSDFMAVMQTEGENGSEEASTA